jgi:hypothetical protein
MPNTCGYAVLTASTTTAQLSGLYTATILTPTKPEYKSSTYPPLLTQFFQQLIHHFPLKTTAVKGLLIPTIHTTNKNNKKFILNNFITYYRKAV